MSGHNPRRLASSKSIKPPKHASRKRVSFAASEDVREFLKESAADEELGAPAWLVPAIPAKRNQEDKSTDVASSSSVAGDGLARRASSDVSSSRFIVATREEPDPAAAALGGKDWTAEHGQDFHDEWSQISIAAQQKVHETARRNSSRRRQSQTSPGTSGPLLPVVLDKPRVDEKQPKKERKKKRKKKKKKKKKKGTKTKKKRKKREMSVMAFLRGSIKRNSKAKVERALKNMMKRIAKRVKKKRGKMVADKDVDMAQVKKAVKRGRRKKQLYTIKKIRGRSIGLNSLLKRWKWAFIFS